MRVPRFTVRPLMAVVAVVALALGIGMRRHAYLGRSRMHGDQNYQFAKLMQRGFPESRDHRFQARRFRLGGIAADWSKAKSEDARANQIEADFRAYSRLAAYHRQMAEKYWQAARLPFWPVDPDPAAPPDPRGP